MDVTLLVPAPLGRISGGYAYDRAMLAGLNATGHRATAVELAGRHPLADQAALAAAAAAFDALAADTIPVIDGLCLAAFGDRAEAIAARRTIGLIHHPASLETGLTDAHRADLAAAERKLLPRFARLVVTSAQTAQRLIADHGIDAARLTVVEPGTAEAPRSTGSGGPHCAVLTVGALIPRKGHDTLLRALARLFDLDWRLTIVGNPDADAACAAALPALAKQLGVADKVVFAGEVESAALETLWRQADIFALASQLEGYGMAIAEALRHGLPVAVIEGGAAGALVVPECGTVSAPGDLATFSKSLRRMIFDTALRHAMADAAWKQGRTLPDWPNQVGRFAAALAA